MDYGLRSCTVNRRELLKRGAAFGTAAVHALSLRAETSKETFGTGAGGFPLAPVYEVSVEYFPGHSLKELTAHVPHIADLGAGTIYLNPIFTCAGLSQYLILDYYAINPRYGTPADLKALVKAAHDRGLRVLLDMVTSLTTEGSYIMREHPQWLMPGDDGKPQHYYPFPAWGWGLDANPQLIRYFSDLAARYVREFDIDGWRIDSPMNNYDPQKVSGDHSRMNLLRSMKASVIKAKPSAYFMAEISGPQVLWGKDDHGAQPLFDEMCEGSYSYKYCGFLGPAGKTGGAYVIFDGSPNVAPLRRTTFDRVVHGELSSAEFVDSVHREPVLYNRLRVNFIENHDTARVSGLFPKAHRAMFVLICAMPGVPVIHAGQEIGSTVHPDASGNTKVVVDWSTADRDLETFYTRVVRVRAANRALDSGDLVDVWKSGDKALAFLRSAGANRLLVALNFSSQPARFTVSIPGAGSFTVRDELSDASRPRSCAGVNPLELNLEPYGYRICSITQARNG
jgi:cyclomaltodextrinase / maltogenic alpha-amylase / neopullulanase